MTTNDFMISTWSSISIVFKDEEAKKRVVSLIEKNFPDLYFEDLDDSILIECQTPKMVGTLKKFFRTL